MKYSLVDGYNIINAWDYLFKREKLEKFDNLIIVFTKENETADNFTASKNLSLGLSRKTKEIII